MAPFATAEELRTHLQRPVDEDVAVQALAGATGAIQAWCGWALARETVTFSMEGTGTYVLGLPTLRLVDVSAVVLDGEALTAEEDYTWAPSGLLRRRAGWPEHVKVDVACTHGFDPIPDVVRLVCLGMAAREINNPERLSMASVGTVTRRYTHELSQLETALLSGFMLPARP